MFYLCIRQTLDWSDEAAFWAQLPVEFAPAVRLWNSTFTIPYHIFRHRVRKIALANSRALANVTVAAWDDIPAGAWVLPADDDDWFSPDIAAVLGPFLGRDARVVGCHWRGSFLEVPLHLCHRLGILQRRLLRMPPKWICCTNNDAVRKSVDLRPAYENHLKASRWFWDQPARVQSIQDRLSIMNRTLASRTSLGMFRPETCQPIPLRRLLARYRHYRRLYRQPLPPALAWCRPWTASMNDLMQDLELR